MGVVAIPSYVLSYIVSNWLSKMSGYDDWKVKTPLFFSSNYIISHSLNKILSRLCGWTYFDCGREVEADQEALKLFGPEACIRSFQQLGYLYDKQIRAIYGEGVLSKDRLSDALKEGFTQKEKTDTLWHSMISLHNYDHPTMYQRIVAAAKIWAKKLTAIHAQAA